MLNVNHRVVNILLKIDHLEEPARITIPLTITADAVTGVSWSQDVREGEEGSLHGGLEAEAGSAADAVSMGDEGGGAVEQEGRSQGAPGQAWRWWRR